MAKIDSFHGLKGDPKKLLWLGLTNDVHKCNHFWGVERAVEQMSYFSSLHTKLTKWSANQQERNDAKEIMGRKGYYSVSKPTEQRSI